MDSSLALQVKTLFEAGDWPAARLHLEGALASEPDNARFLFLNAVCRFMQEDYAGSARDGEDAYSLDPSNADYADFLAVLFIRVGLLNKSLFFTKLSGTGERDPELASFLPEELPTLAKGYNDIRKEPLLTKAIHASRRGNWEEARHWTDQHLAFFPNDIRAFKLLGRILIVHELFPEALDILRGAVHTPEADAETFSLLASTLTQLGRFDQARAVHAQAIKMAPQDPVISGQAVSDALHDPGLRGGLAVDVCRQWGEGFGASSGYQPTFVRAEKPVLTIGYVFGHLPRNEIGPALGNMLACHDDGAFRIVGFGLGELADDANIIFQRGVGTWHNIADIDPLTFASIVTSEGVDILVDLSGFGTPLHMSAFGTRMAPVQMAWLGAMAGTGLAQMDYLIGDGVLDADPSAHPALAEKTVGLELGAFVAAIPDIEGIGRAQTDRITFSADVQLSALTPDTVELWSTILRRLPKAMLILNDHGFDGEAGARELLERFGNFGVTHQVDVVSGVERLGTYAMSDITLVAPGAISPQLSLDALCQGVPVIAMRQKDRRLKLTESLIEHLGLAGQCLADDFDGYVEKALWWVSNQAEFKTFAAGTPSQVATSDVLDPAKKIKDLENLFRKVWSETVES